jgi:hypothetical protein
MRADGSGARRLHTDVFAADQEPPPAWSHDGRRVAFVAMPSPKRAEIKRMNRDGGNVRILKGLYGRDGTRTRDLWRDRPVLALTG